MMPGTLRGSATSGYGTPRPIVSQARMRTGMPASAESLLSSLTKGTTKP